MKRLLSHLSPYEHVIWDWNGTLMADVDHAVNAVNHLMRTFGRSEISVEDYKKVFGFPVRDYYQRLGFDLEKEKFEDLSKTFITRYMEGFHLCGLVPGAKDLLAQIKESRKTQSVLSAARQEDLEHKLDHYELTPYFDNIYGIADIYAASKLNRGQQLMEQVAVAPSATVLIGDTDHDLEVGQQLGVNVILVAHGHQSAERLREIHDFVFDLDQETLS